MTSNVGGSGSSNNDGATGSEGEIEIAADMHSHFERSGWQNSASSQSTSVAATAPLQLSSCAEYRSRRDRPSLPRPAVTRTLLEQRGFPNYLHSPAYGPPFSGPPSSFEAVSSLASSSGQHHVVPPMSLPSSFELRRGPTDDKSYTATQQIAPIGSPASNRVPHDPICLHRIV